MQMLTSATSGTKVFGRRPRPFSKGEGEDPPPTPPQGRGGLNIRNQSIGWWADSFFYWVCEGRFFLPSVVRMTTFLTIILKMSSRQSEATRDLTCMQKRFLPSIVRMTGWKTYPDPSTREGRMSSRWNGATRDLGFLYLEMCITNFFLQIFLIIFFKSYICAK